MRRRREYLTHPVFHAHRSETAMLRYLRRLADKDFALDRGMIPLGSCTMKLNATTEMEPDHLARVRRPPPVRPGGADRGHPRRSSPSSRAGSARSPATTPSRSSPTRAPRASSPASSRSAPTTRPAARPSATSASSRPRAHGTNAASAVMAGMKVVVVGPRDDGNVDMDDLRPRSTSTATTSPRSWSPTPRRTACSRTRSPTCAPWCTTPAARSTSTARTSTPSSASPGPGKFGADVSHLNLHKTFCIPHGGGGPGVGPVAVREHLAPYLPNHPLGDRRRPRTGVGPVSAAPFGSAGILPIRWAYVRLMGGAGPDAGDAGRHPQRQLRRRPAPRPLPGPLRRPRRPRRARVHPRPARDHQADRRHRRRRRQAARRLRLPRADDVLPGRGHAHGRADRERGQGRARPVRARR